MRKIYQASIMMMFICICVLFSGCSEKKSVMVNTVEYNDSVSVSDSNSRSNQIFNDNPFQYTPYTFEDNLYYMKNTRSVNGKQYTFGCNNYIYVGTYVIDIKNITVKKLDYFFDECKRPYIYDGFLYEVYAQNYDECCISVTDLNDRSDVKKATIKGSYLSPLAVSPKGTVYYYNDGILSVLNQDLQLIRQIDCNGLGITKTPYICCDKEENIYFCSYNNDESSYDYSVRKLDSDFKEIYNKSHNFKNNICSFFINTDMTVCVSTIKYYSDDSRLYTIDALNGEFLSEYDIPCNCIFLNGTQDYDCTYYTSENNLYGFNYNDRSSQIILDNSDNISEDQLVMLNGNNLYQRYSYSDTFLLTTSHATNPGFLEIITDGKNENRFYFDINDNYVPFADDTYISSSGEIYFTHQVMRKPYTDGYNSSLNYDHTLYKISSDGQKSSVTIHLPDNFGKTNILAVDDTNNIYIGKFENQKLILEIFDSASRYIGDTMIEDLYQIKSYFIFENSLYIYYADIRADNHMIRINSKSKNFQTVTDFENTNFRKIINGTDEYNLYIIEDACLYGYTFDGNKYVKLTDDLESSELDMDKANIFAVNKEKFLIETGNTYHNQERYLMFEKKK